MAYKLMIRFTSIINGLRVSKLSQALKSARTDIENSEIIKLTNKDRDLFLKSIEKKITPNKAFNDLQKDLIVKGGCSSNKALYLAILDPKIKLKVEDPNLTRFPPTN